MKNVQKGFTLIELMIVVAIIAILAAIAIPQYQNYITKSQFSESQTVADGLKTPIVEWFNQTGGCPSNTTTGFQTNTAYVGKYVSQVDLKSAATTTCLIEVKFKAAGSVSTPLATKVVTFASTNNGGTITWQCLADGTQDSSSISGKYLPQVCKAGSQ
ncbi:pilin [Dyella kyungheensis]|uniref:pilin n=1 Tax=Dyella kyungheensis TaxID=1242174 RepID=UPI003CF623AC